MTMRTTARTLAAIDGLEYRLCRWMHGAGRYRPARLLFALVSRIGDGMIWYVLMLSMPLAAGKAGLLAAFSMAVGALAGLLLYKGLKTLLLRDRPFIVHPDIDCLTAPLDRYSFPSGHTLHAVFFAVVATAWFPVLSPWLFGFAALVALSRPVLGLHYPTDVLVGGLIGWALAELVLNIIPPGAMS